MSKLLALLLVLLALSATIIRAEENTVNVAVNDGDEDADSGSAGFSEEQLAQFKKAAEYERQKKLAEDMLKEALQEDKAIDTGSPDAALTVLLDNVRDQKTLVQGETIDLLLGFHNKGKLPFNITQISAAIVYAGDFRQYVQNFTKDFPFAIVNSGEERTFLYAFRPDPLLEPRDWGLIATVTYTDGTENTTFSNTVLNATVAIVEPDTTMDAQTFFTYLLLFGLLALIGFGAFKLLGSKKVTRRISTRSSTAREMGTVGSAADTDEVN